MRLGIVTLVALAGCELAQPRIAATTALSSTTDTVGPYTVEVAIDGDIGDRVVRLHSAIGTADSNRFLAVEMTPVARHPQLFAGEIAGEPAGTDVFYFVEIVDRDLTLVDRDPPERVFPNAFGFQVLPAGM